MKKVSFTLRIEEKLLDKLRIQSAKSKVPISEIIVNALKKEENINKK